MKNMILAIAATVICVISSAGTALATETPNSPTMQSRVDAVLAEHPGGTQVGWNEVSWNGTAA